MAGRQSSAMEKALKLHQRDKGKRSVREIAADAGVSHTGLYAAIRAAAATIKPKRKDQS